MRDNRGMSAYTIKNLKDVEDMAPQFGQAPSLEARFAREPLGCTRTGLSYQRLAPGCRAPFGHRHGDEEEIYVVVGGSGRMNLEGDVVELRQWDAVRVAPQTARAIEAGDDGIEFLAFGSPGGGAADAELLPGWWGD